METLTEQASGQARRIALGLLIVAVVEIVLNGE